MQKSRCRRFTLKERVPPDIEVFVHASEEGFSKFGHVDLYFEGRVYTYGCYDDRTKWFFTRWAKDT